MARKSSKTMSSNRRALVARILTFATFVVGLFLVASLVTYHAEDPPAGGASPVRNLGGPWGAIAAHYLYHVLGIGSFLVVALGMALAGAYVVLGALPRRLLVSASVLAAGIFLVLSLLTFDAAHDPHRYSGVAEADNACGLVGRTVGYYLLDYVGAGVWVLLAGAFVAVGTYVARRPMSDRLLRGVGLVLLACFVTSGITLLNRHGLFRPAGSDVLPAGLGGVWGTFMADTFLVRVGAVGAYGLLAIIAAVGLILVTDGLALTWPVALWRWTQKRKIARFERIRDASDRLRRGYVAAREAMATGAAVGAAAVSTARQEARAAREAARAEKDRLKQEREEAKAQAKDAAETARQEPAAAAKPAEAKAADEAEAKKSRLAPKIRTPEERKAPAEEHRPQAGDPSQMKLADAASALGEEMAAYKFPSLDLLEPAEDFDVKDEEVHIRQNAVGLEATLQQFGVQAEVVGIDTGPVITQYEVSLGAGIKVGKVISLSDDLAIGLKAPSVRIIAPLPGRGTIGIEVPNRNAKIVRIREAIEDGLPLTKRHNLPLFLGKDSAGNPLVRDLTAMPHLLIGGTTGSGKSVCLNTVINSILFTRSPRDVKFILVDPKMVEMAMFSQIPHLMCPVVSDMSKVYSILEWLIGKMQERYGLLAEAGVKNIVGYNALTREQIVDRFKPTSEEDALKLTYHMPYIILIVDELADLMMSAPKEVEAAITRLAQKSRAVGIHLVLATQRPSVDVVTGLIKSNHPCRIAFQVATRVDSRTILDSMGAEKLLGRGDMLLMQPGAAKLIRGQGAFISEQEISRVVEAVSDSTPRTFNRELVQLKPKDPKPARGRAAPTLDDDSDFAERDELYNDAVRVVLQHQRGSVSLLQRKLNIGYGRASRLIDFMAEAGLVGE